MDSEEQMANERRDNWYVIKGIPVAVLATLGLQTVTFVWFLSGLNSRVEIQGDKLAEAITEWKAGNLQTNAKIDALAVSVQSKIEALANNMQSGSVPAALNERRIAEAERQLGRIEARVAENERKLAGEALRNRAMRER